jgi:3-mercaptopyruvate sulfurtransferase SseA
VDDIGSPADPGLAAGDQEHARSATNAAWAAAIVAVALAVAAIAVVISLRGGPAAWRAMNTQGPEGDKRNAPRQRTFKKTVFKDGAFTYDRTVRNLSATGAQLQGRGDGRNPEPIPAGVW